MKVRTMMSYTRSARSRAAYLPILCAAVLAAALAPSVQAASLPFNLPPLVQGASAEHHKGKVIWVDLITPDMARAEPFYAGLFGWKFDAVAGDPNYVIASLDGQPVGGLYQKSPTPNQARQPAWLTFIAARDVDAARRLALAHGAKLLSGPKNYPQRGRQAVFSDPDGAVFAVLASSSGDPPDFLAAPGEWIWSSLLVHDADHEAAFYQTLFGYDVFDLPNDGPLEHLILSSDDYARVGVNSLPNDSAHRRPHWLNFVRVVDAADTATRAATLGGRVLVEPRLDRHGGRVAVIADPTGAPFGIMEWSQSDTQQEPK
jgi:predicted enzyme related to lactoylglutathione lyase